MLSVKVKVNNRLIADLAIQNVGKATPEEAYYKVTGHYTHTEGATQYWLWGDIPRITHNPADGALVLIRKALEALEK